MTTSRPLSFSVSQRVLHWLTAALVTFNLVLPDGMSDWNRSMERDGMASADQVASANIHAYVGISILALVVLRLIIRFTRGVPASPPQEPPIFRMAATAAHASTLR